MSEHERAGRETLGFVDAVHEAFGSLAREHALNEVGSDAHTVHYQGPAGWLTVTHDPLSYELDMSFTPVGIGVDRPFGLADFIRVADRDRADDYRSFAATSPRAVRLGVERLADDLRTFAEPALRCDRSFLTRVAEIREEGITEFGREMNRGRDDQAADQAMRDHDWPRIVQLYEPREDQLNRVEQRRLDVARKRLAGT